jgi:hypothetical protein
MISLKRVNSMGIVVINGKIYNNNNITDEIWNEITNLALEVQIEFDDEVYARIISEILDLIEPTRLAIKNAEKLAKDKLIEDYNLETDSDKRLKKAIRIEAIPGGLFEYDVDGIVYLKGFKHPMPKMVADAILDAYYNPNSNYTIDAIINFWKFLLLNPDKHIRYEAFEWFKTSKFSITDEGCIISYRNVDVKQNGVNKELEDFITQSWLKIKGQKKSPKNYYITKDDAWEWKLTSDSELSYFSGNLDEIYNASLNIVKNNTIYTDNYTKSMIIEIGKEVSMNRSDCDNDSDSSCSRGLHCKSINYGLNLGSDVIVTLVNPFNIVAVPSHDRTKFRCCAYMPIGKADLDENNKLIEFEPGTYDIPYIGLTNLSDLLQYYTFEELQSNNIISSELNKEDFISILQNAQDIINVRNI